MLAGSERDLRFLRSRIGKRLGIELVPLADWAAVHALPAGSAGFLEVPADAGFVDKGLMLVAAPDLLGSRAMNNGASLQSSGAFLLGAGEIGIGDVIVHEDHGVGIVAGLELSPEASQDGEMIALEYAGGSRPLVATDEAKRIWRYGGDA